VQPGFIASAQGCRVTDVDGRSYIDFLCANGPNLLGYRHPQVEAAARRQMERADATSYFPPALVELAERLVARTPGMDWAIPAKNGSDVVALAARVARAASGRDRLLLFARAYHGFDPEWVPGGGGVPRVRRESVLRSAWNDVDQLGAIEKEAGTTVAAIVLNPLDQNPGLDTVPPSIEFLQRIREFCDRAGALLILDDVRAGFRLHPLGSQLELGLQPDLICLGKALGNGYAMAALLGTDALRGAARQLLFTSTSVFGAVALRAAIKTLEVYDRDAAFDRMLRAGERLRAGFLNAAARTDHEIRYTGPPTMPTLLLENDGDGRRIRRFAREAALRGALFHPNLNWFLSAAHDDASIDEALAIALEAFEATPRN
jgi:glutamate-1-semialdehyde 2,1-aminomutase